MHVGVKGLMLLSTLNLYSGTFTWLGENLKESSNTPSGKTNSNLSTTNSHNLLYLLLAVNIEDCKSWWLSDCSGRALVAQARGVLGSTPGDCRPFHFSLFSPHNILFSTWDKILSIEIWNLKMKKWISVAIVHIHTTMGYGEICS